jgi:hypothetical protein
VEVAAAEVDLRSAMALCGPMNLTAAGVSEALARGMESNRRFKALRLGTFNHRRHVFPPIPPLLTEAIVRR